MEAQQFPFDDIEDIMVSGSQEKRAELLGLLIDLLLVGSGGCSAEQFKVCVGFFSHCAEWVDTKTRAEFANRLAPEPNAPAEIVRALAGDPDFEVAGPILSRSTQLTDDDLLACANGKGEQWLLAVAKRASLSEAISDLLVSQGTPEVVRSVAKNEGARFSDAGFGKLVQKCKDDDQLAVNVGSRRDIPQKYIADLGKHASGEVFKTMVHAIAAAREADKMRDFGPVRALYDAVVSAGDDIGPVVREFVQSGQFDQTVVALALLCRFPVETVGNIMVDKRAGDDLPLALAKSARLPWPIALTILKLHGGAQGLTPEQIETARADFDNLHAGTAQRMVQLYQARHAVNRRRSDKGGRVIRKS